MFLSSYELGDSRKDFSNATARWAAPRRLNVTYSTIAVTASFQIHFARTCIIGELNNNAKHAQTVGIYVMQPGSYVENSK